MERLTVPAERLPDGRTRLHIIDARKVKEKAMEVYWRLKKYEDTGLSPEDVVDLMGNHAMAISQLAKTPKWIPATERLPLQFVEVLLWDAIDEDVFTGVLDGNGDWVVPRFEDESFNITHWMPFPKPPKGG